ncbi:MAG TPA: hypothetical protein VK699_18430 [Terriglobales bacterium]|jgi:hypothetical protein|nr:hypothetical protein [Terriglobales bacterium]
MALAACLVDTNILLRMTRRSDPQHQLVDAALAQLAGQGTILHYTHQNIAELWNAMTRPLARNGFGLTVLEAEREVLAIETGMIFYPTTKRFIESGGGLSYSMEYWAFRYMMPVWSQRCTCTG